MSLYLGRLGRKIVDFSITNKTAGKILNGIGRGINHLSSNYVVSLTRESFMLSQRVKAGDNIDIKSDGFYVGERQVLPSAQLAQNLLNSGTSKFSIDNMFSEPENLALAFRTILNRETSLDKTDCESPKMSKRSKVLPFIACISLGALLGSGGAIYFYIVKNQRIQQRIQNEVDPTSVCQTYSPDRILQEVEFEDRSTAHFNISLDDVKRIMAGIDYRFTSGIKRVVLEDTLRGVVEGTLKEVNGLYEVDTQTIRLAKLFAGKLIAHSSHLWLSVNIIHEIGHHVQWKTIDFGHELPSWEGADPEKFANTFTYIYLYIYNLADFYPPPADPKRVAIMRSILFCDSSPF